MPLEERQKAPRIRRIRQDGDDDAFTLISYRLPMKPT
jgi:hypothetical protein